jgi:quercetin dioxygenase-like cupin family protein
VNFVDTLPLRPFSSAKLAKHNLFETPQMFCDLYLLEPGQSQKAHAHTAATKFYFVLEGRPTLVVGEERRALGPGGLAWAAAGQVHGVENETGERAVLLVAMAPNPNA